jgi:HlyD family secretion protein
MRKRVLVWLSVLGLCVAMAWIGRAAVATKPDRGGTTEVIRVQRRDIGAVVKATGVIKPVTGAEVRVGSQLAGVVKRLRVRIGDRVRRGQLLAELDPRALLAKRNQAALALASAEANLAYAEGDLLRQRTLAQSGAISPGALDQVNRVFSVAKASVGEGKANLAYAEAELGYARLVSPIDGVVAAVALEEGETVSPSAPAPAFITVMDLSRLEVWAYVDETDVGRVQPDQAVRFSVDTYPDQLFDGAVSAIYPKPEIRDNVVNYVAAVKFVAPRAQILRPEMTTNVSILLERHQHVLAIPRRAVHRDQGQEFVLVLAGNVTERRKISLGSHDDGYCEVTDGLKEGESVVASTSPSETSKKGQSQ